MTELKIGDIVWIAAYYKNQVVVVSAKITNIRADSDFLKTRFFLSPVKEEDKELLSEGGLLWGGARYEPDLHRTKEEALRSLRMILVGQVKAFKNEIKLNTKFVKEIEGIVKEVDKLLGEN